MHLLDRCWIPPGKFGEVYSVIRGAWMEFKGKPGDVEVDIRFALQSIDDTRADIAERSNVIGIDRHIECHEGTLQTTSGGLISSRPRASSDAIS
jgi:hypothetical protein